MNHLRAIDDPHFINHVGMVGDQSDMGHFLVGGIWSRSKLEISGDVCEAMVDRSRGVDPPFLQATLDLVDAGDSDPPRFGLVDP